MDRSGPPPGHVPVARIGRSHGLHGAVRVQPDTAAGALALAAVSSLWVEGFGDSDVERFVPHGREFLLQLARVRRVETAKRLVHARVYVPREVLAAANETDAADARAAGDPVVWIGLPVRHDDAVLGTVVAVEGSPMQPLLRVRGAAGDVLLPALAPYVRAGSEAVDLVDPPEGLIETP